MDVKDSSTVQYYTIQYNTIQYNTIQYNTHDDACSRPVPETVWLNLSTMAVELSEATRPAVLFSRVEKMEGMQRPTTEMKNI